MAERGKKYRAAREKVSDAELSAEQAMAKVKDLAHAKFDESVDLHINLGIDPAKGEHSVRGSLVLPHSLGKAPRVIVFAKNEYADAAKKAGADLIGTDDLIEKIQGGWLDFDYAVSTPDLMGMVGKLAKILGPRGLLPNKKVGTVTFDVGDVVNDLKKGRVFFKNDKSGLVHFTIGKASFAPKNLYENFLVFIQALSAAKPASSKGRFIRKITLCPTMGPAVRVNPEEAVK